MWKISVGCVHLVVALQEVPFHPTFPRTGEVAVWRRKDLSISGCCRKHEWAIWRPLWKEGVGHTRIFKSYILLKEQLSSFILKPTCIFWRLPCVSAVIIVLSHFNSLFLICIHLGSKWNTRSTLQSSSLLNNMFRVILIICSPFKQKYCAGIVIW